MVETNDDSRGEQNTNSQIRLKTSMSKSSLCDDRDTCILVKENITAIGARADNAARTTDRNDK